jgi:hypothetical protein
LLFFTGFALMRGWLPRPAVRRDLMLLAGAFVIFALLTGSPRIRDLIELPREVYFANWPAWARWMTPKTDFGLLRYLHLLSLAYLAWCLAGPAGRRLRAPEGARFAVPWRLTVSALLKVGQQSLAIFIVSMWLSRVLGMGIDLAGPGYNTMLIVNLVGRAQLVVAAYAIAWFKKHPRRKRRTEGAAA